MAGFKLLVAVGESASSAGELPPGVRALLGAADEVLVISPRLPGRLEWLSSATDKATEEADERLRRVLGQLAEIGTEAEGQLAADDPLVAFDDAVARFSPDHILVGLRDEEGAGWQESGLLEDLRGRFRLPITVFELRS